MFSIPHIILTKFGPHNWIVRIYAVDLVKVHMKYKSNCSLTFL